MYKIAYLTHIIFILLKDYPGSSAGKESTWNAGDLGSIPELGRSPGEGHGNLLQYSGLENPHGQRSLVGYRSQSRRVRHDWATISIGYIPKKFFFFFPIRSILSHLGKFMAYWHIWKMLKMNRMKSKKKLYIEED